MLDVSIINLLSLRSIKVLEGRVQHGGGVWTRSIGDYVLNDYNHSNKNHNNLEKIHTIKF